MKQVYHSNATTNVRLRNEINNSNGTYLKIAKKFGVSVNTVKKWKNRETFKDKSSRPKTIKYALSELKMLIAIELRVLTWWALDEITEALNSVEPEKIRSAVYRTFVREGINKLPEKEKEKAKKFKEYDPGYLHIDVTYLPKLNGVKYYLFVAIDRATRTLYYKIYDAKTSENAESFMLECLEFFPFEITHVLTDNGLEFTNRLLKDKKGNYSAKPSKLDVICQENDIDHRCTKPFTPKTNGMVEKANDIIKKKTIKITKYNSLEEMNDDLMQFLVHYNLCRRHGSLRRELKVKTPFNAIEKWYELDEKIFKIKPQGFKNKILSLKSKQVEKQQQPCET
ncbi:MAG TPA: IS481 family transposase [Flavobacteriaceae bacterium]|nr:IS481 family transposase [Flavobacteriaceae bacterium]